jgi:hypothetical protein
MAKAEVTDKTAAGSDSSQERRIVVSVSSFVDGLRGLGRGEGDKLFRAALAEIF